MITRGYFIGQIIDELTAVSQQVKSRAGLQLFDLNRYLEDFFKDILNIVYGYKLKNLDYTLAGGIAEKIRCPVLVCDAEGDLFFKGQPQKLYDHLTCEKTLMLFTAEEGAGAHCEVGAARLANARMFDWLDETLGWVGEV